MPPPPVTGAALGILLADAVAPGVIVTVAVAVAVAVWGAGELVVTPGVPGDVVLPSAGVLPADAGALVAEVDTVGVKVGTVGVEVEFELQAATAAGTSRVRAPQHTAVSLAPSTVPAVVLRSFMGPPRAPG